MRSGEAVRIGLIGAGRMGIVHAEALSYFVPGAEVVAIADINLDAARACAERFDIPAHFDDVGPLLEGDCDAVVIASTSNTHAQLIEAAASAGKAIFCEKPVDLDLAVIGHVVDGFAFHP